MNKKIGTVFLLIFICGFAKFTFAQSLKGGVNEKRFVDYMEAVGLTESQKAEVARIRKEEENVLRPYVLDLSSKERGLKMLNSLECPRFDYTCKNRLKEDIEQVEFEKAEIIRKINQKRTYYNIRYRNVLTREQDIKIQQMTKETEHINKVLQEREEKQKKEARKEKLKFWNKFKKKNKSVV